MQNSSIDSFKKFISIYFIIIAFFLLFIEVFIRSFIITIPKSVPHRIHSVYSDTNINVAFGDSHIFRSFIGQSDYLNLGRGGSTIPVIDILIRNYFKFRIPGNVIIEASPQFISTAHLDFGDKNHSKYFKLNHPLIPKIYFFEPGITQELAKIRSWKYLKKVVNGDWPDEHEKSSIWAYMNNEERLKKTKSRVEFQEPEYDSNRAEIYLSIYKSFLQFLKNKGATICILRTPVDENYLRLIDSHNNFQRSIEEFKEIAKELRIKYVDFRELPMDFGFDKFINQDHLMPHVSEQFVDLVDEACFG